MANYNPDIFRRYDSSFGSTENTPRNAEIGDVGEAGRVGERVEYTGGLRPGDEMGRDGIIDQIGHYINQQRAEENRQPAGQAGAPIEAIQRLTPEAERAIIEQVRAVEERTGQALNRAQIQNVVLEQGHPSSGLSETVDTVLRQLGRLGGEMARNRAEAAGLPIQFGQGAARGIEQGAQAAAGPIKRALRAIKSGIVNSFLPLLRSMGGSMRNNPIKSIGAATAGTVGLIAYRKDIGTWLSTIYNRILGGQATQEEIDEVNELVDEHTKHKGTPLTHAIESGDFDYDTALFNAVFNAVKSRDMRTVEDAKKQIYILLMARSYLIHRRTMDNLDEALKNGGRIVPRMGRIPINPALNSPYVFGWTPQT